MDTGLPLWSAHALVSEAGLATLRSLHEDYARAGADVLVTNTFRTSRRSLAKTGRGLEWKELNRRAVECAREAVLCVSPPCLVAGSIAPLEDCYSPELVPSAERCEREHDEHVELLLTLGVDFILVETMNTVREAAAALRAVSRRAAAAIVSLCPGPDPALISGEPLADAVPRLMDAGGDSLRGISLNCATLEILARIYPAFAAIEPSLPHGLYAHLGEPLPDGGWRIPKAHAPDEHARWTADRVVEGARIVGGCCGTTPAHTAAQRRLLGSIEGPRLA